MLVQEGTVYPNYNDTTIHALDERDNLLCGVTLSHAETWFSPREGTDSEVTCEGCREAMADLDEEWEDDEEEEEEEEE